MYLADLVPQEDLPQSNTLLQTLSVIVLLVHASVQPYKKKWLNVLDTFLLADITLLSMLAAVSASPLQYSGINLFFFETAPYILILFPFCYLFGTFAVLLFKRVKVCTKKTTLYSILAGSNRRPTRNVIAMENAADNDSEAKESDFTDSFFNDEGEREPLLLTTSFKNDTPAGQDYQRRGRQGSCVSHSSVCLSN